MVKSPELDEFCQLLLEVASAMKKSNELPAYLVGKAREINAGHHLKKLEEAVNNEELNLMELFNKAHPQHKICSEEDSRRKLDVVDKLYNALPKVNRIKAGSFKLMLDRFVASHKLAIRYYEIIEELLLEYEKQLGPKQAEAQGVAFSKYQMAQSKEENEEVGA